jgi:hypothetical protein
MDDTTDDKREAPFSIRLTRAERARLESQASGLAIAAYVKGVLFSETAPQRFARGKAPVKDHTALAAVLARLGQTRIANNLNQLARAAHAGVLPVDDDTRAQLSEAYREVREIRALLLRGLGVEGAAGEAVEQPRPSARATFAQASADPREGSR